MRTISGSAGVIVLLACGGCSSSGSPAAGPAPTSPPSQVPYVVPKHIPGELARAMFDVHRDANREVAGEAVPKRNVTYEVRIACLSGPAQQATIRWQARIARPQVSRVFQAGSIPCDGEANTFQLAPIPRQPIQLAMTWAGVAGPRAYGVIAPS